MNGFDANHITFFTTGLPGNCPFCGSENLIGEEHVSEKKLVLNERIRYSVSFKCPDCGASDHGDGFVHPRDPNWYRNKA